MISMRIVSTSLDLKENAALKVIIKWKKNYIAKIAIHFRFQYGNQYWIHLYAKPVKETLLTMCVFVFVCAKDCVIFIVCVSLKLHFIKSTYNSSVHPSTNNRYINRAAQLDYICYPNKKQRHKPFAIQTVHHIWRIMFDDVGAYAMFKKSPYFIRWFLHRFSNL